MKQIIILSFLIISTFGAKLNQYLPPRPENHNAQFLPPALPTGNLPEQPFEPPQFDQTNQQRFSPKASDQSRQPSSPFSQKNEPRGNVYGAPEQSVQSSSPFGQKTSSSEQPLQKNSFNGNTYGTPEQSGQSPSPFGQSPSPFGQSPSSFGQLPQKNTFNTNPSRQYLTPNNKDTSGQKSNSFGQFQSPTTGYSQGKTGSFGLQSQEPFPNQVPAYNGQSVNQQNTFSGGQSNFGPQSAPIGLIRSEINPDAGDGHYNYLYETENGITVQEEGFEKSEGKSAQGGYSYTSPEGEQISIEYTADANGFIPKGSHVPEIPEAIAKSIELNKAAEARGEYNEGSYREEYNDEPTGYQGNAPTGQPSFNSYQAPLISGNQDNDYKNSGPDNTNNFSDQGTFASQDNKQVSPFGQANNVPGSQTPFGQQSNVPSSTYGPQNNGPKSSFGQNNGYQGTFPSQPSKVTPFGQQNNGPKSSFGQNKNGYQGTFPSQPSKQVTPFGQQNNGPKSSFGQNKNGYQGTFPSQPSKQVTPFGQQNNGPKSSFGQNKNGYQYSAPGKTSFVDQGTFASQPSKQPTPFGQQNNVPSTAFGQQNNVPSTAFGQQNKVPSTAFGQQNNAPSNAFGQQNNVPSTAFGQQNNVPSTAFGQQNVPSTAFGQQNNGPKSSFGQQINGGKSASNNGYQYPTPEQNSFGTQQIKKVAPFGSQETKSSSQYAPRPQYEAPVKTSTNNDKFTFQNVPQVPSGQFGTVQDDQGGYKY